MSYSPSWYLNAACAGQDPELFFPVSPPGVAFVQVQRAKQVCAGCPVRSLCLDTALATCADHGIWGGLTEEERRALRRRAGRNRMAMTAKNSRRH